MGIVAKLGIKTSILFPLIAALVGCGGGPAGGGGVVSEGGGGQVKIGDRGGQAFSEGTASSELLSVNSSNATWEVGVVVVDGNNFAVNESFDVRFSSSCVDSGLAQIDGAATPKTVPTQAGRASILYNSGQCDGVDSVVATLTSGISVLVASADLDIDAAIRGSSEDGGSGPLTVRIGDRGGEDFSEGTAASSLLRVDSDNATWEISVIVVDGNNFAATESFDITFSSSCVDSGLAQIDGEAAPQTVSTEAGRASIEYSSGQCDGVDSVVATLTSNGAVLRASVDLDIDAAIRNGNDGGDGPITVLMGNGTGSSFVENELLASSTSLQAGASALISVNFVDINGAPYTPSVSVTFSSGCVSRGLASFMESMPVSTQGGLATTTFVASGCSGDDVIEARATVNGSALRAEVAVNVALDTVLTVEFVSIEQPFLSIAGIGGIETSDVFFRIVGAQGAPIVGEAVSFEVTNSAGGATLAVGSESGVTDSSGQVRTVVQSGTVNSTTQVLATHDATGLQGYSEAISISAGVPISRSFDLSFTPHNPRAANVNGTEVQVTANATDRFGNSPPDGTRVSFRSVEVGLIDSECELVNGVCTVTWSSSGSRAAITPDTLGRGFRATVIGFMTGAENFKDFNSNGLFDFGRDDEQASIENLGEVYTDENENGVYDFGEDFVDSFLNNPAPSAEDDGGINGAYDGPDDPTYEIYNGPCSTAINDTCPATRLQSIQISDQVVISLSSELPALCDRGTLPADGVAITGVYPFAVSGMSFCDINRNSLPANTTIQFDVAGTGLVIVGPSTFEVSNFTTEPTLGQSVVLNSTAGPSVSGLLTIIIKVPGVADQILGSWSVQGL